MNKSRGVVIFGSILAALQFLAAASALGDIIGKAVFAMFVIAVGAIQVGWAAYQQNQVVPFGDTAAYLNSRGEMVAGPAAGVTNGKTVDVVKTEPPASESEFIAGEHRATPNEFGRMDLVGALMVVALVVVIIVFLEWALPGLHA